MKTNKIPSVKSISTIKVIRPKKKRVKDPVRNPKVIVPIEAQFKNGYVKTMNNIVKMVQVELVKQTK